MSLVQINISQTDIAVEITNIRPTPRKLSYDMLRNNNNNNNQHTYEMVIYIIKASTEKIRKTYNAVFAFAYGKARNVDMTLSYKYLENSVLLAANNSIHRIHRVYLRQDIRD